MPQSDPMTVLLVNDHAEEIKLVTMSLRSFYPGCRVEAVYSADEALEWASKLDWHIILLNEHLPHERESDLLLEMRRRAPRSAIIVEGERQDPRVALQVMRNGADYYCYKDLPRSLMNLSLVTREVLEKRDLRSQLDRSLDRYRQLIDNLSETVYELDPEGRFVYISPAVKELVHFEPQDLIGLPYWAFLPADERVQAKWRVNERRSRARATRNWPLHLRTKDNEQGRVAVEVSATGLYNLHQQYLGTSGVLRHVVAHHDHERLLRRLSELPASLTTIVTTAEQLLQTVRGLQEEFTPALSRVAGSGAGSMSTTAPETSLTPPALKSEDNPSFSERRRVPRLDIQVEMLLRDNGTTWSGTALNVSVGGVYMVFKGPVDLRVPQGIQLGFTSDVGILNVSGTVCGIREPLANHDQYVKTHVTGIAVELSRLDEAERSILNSLFDGLRSGSITVKLSGLLRPQEEIGQHHNTEAVHKQTTPGQSSLDPSKLNEGGPPDRRISARVHLVVPIHLESVESSSKLSEFDAHLIDLTTTGARLRVQALPQLVGSRLRLRLLFSALPSSQSTEAKSFQECSAIGEVVWVAPALDSIMNSAGASVAMASLIGVRFIRFDGQFERRIANLITQYLTSADRIEEPTEATMLVSELLECFTAKGRRIVMYHDHPREALPPGSPLVVLAPGFGETKKDYISLAYFFASNGFRVLRYDHTQHIGDSEGEILSTTLSSMKDDLSAVLDYADRVWPASPALIVATGLTGRVVLKALTQSRRVRLVVVVGGVVDVQSTLRTVHEEDLVSTHLQGVRRGISNLLGVTVDADRWLADATRHEYADLNTTLNDSKQIKTPVIFFSSEHDTWVDQSALKKVTASLREYAIDWYLLPEAVHHVHKLPDLAKDLYRQVVQCCRAWCYPLTSNANPFMPAEREIERQVRLERERARTQHHMARAESFEFWREYLDQSQFIVNFSDYWHLLDHIYRLMGPLTENDRILDAGCGNGNFGTFLFINECYRLRHSSMRHQVEYWGVDFVISGLSQAKQNLARVVTDIHERFPSTQRTLPTLTPSFMQADLDQTLPFRDNHFHRVLCNLVIGYVRDPLFTLRELMRTLFPGGKLVLTIFKPQADLSQVYRNFLGLGKAPEEIEKAKLVLDTSGRIAQREREGVFRFFDPQELAVLLLSSGAQQPRIYSAFANQAYIAVAEKP